MIMVSKITINVIKATYGKKTKTDLKTLLVVADTLRTVPSLSRQPNKRSEFLEF